MKRLVDDLNSPNVRVIFDPVNYINTANYKNQDEIINTHFDLLGEKTKLLHLKDFKLVDGEVAYEFPCDGLLNKDLLWDKLKQYNPDIAVILEEVKEDHLALILRQQGFQCFKIIAVDDHVLTAVVLGVLPLLIKTVLPLQHPEGNFLMMVHDFIFTDPFQGWHGVFLQSKNFKLRTKRTHCCGKQGVRIYKRHFCVAKCLLG